MESTPKMSRQEFLDRMRQKVEEALGQVADAINQAPPALDLPAPRGPEAGDGKALDAEGQAA